MLRQSDINQAFRESVAVNPKGYRYLLTRDFVCALQRKGIHFSGREANHWIERNQNYFVDKSTEEGENRLWMLRNMGRVL